MKIFSITIYENNLLLTIFMTYNLWKYYLRFLWLTIYENNLLLTIFYDLQFLWLAIYENNLRFLHIIIYELEFKNVKIFSITLLLTIFTTYNFYDLQFIKILLTIFMTYNLWKYYLQFLWLIIYEITTYNFYDL